MGYPFVTRLCSQLRKHLECRNFPLTEILLCRILLADIIEQKVWHVIK